MKPGDERNKLPWWCSCWLVFSGVICTWDALFVLLRPHTMPGGKYYAFWKPYSIYIEVDKRYADMTDTFVYCQSLMNLVEVVLDFIALYLSSQRSRHAPVVAFLASVMTGWKTVLYMLQYMEFVGGGEYHAHSSTMDQILMLWIPGAIWTMLPTLVVAAMWNRMAGDDTSRNKRKLK